MKKYILLLSFLICNMVHAQDIIQGESNPQPYKPYPYKWNLIVGIAEYATTWTWKVTNGKIMDKNGEFVLTTLDTDINSFSPIYVMWECNDTGKIELIGRTSLRVKIQPCNVHITDEIYSNYSDISIEAVHLTLKNVTIEKNANISLNGYKSVLINSDFKANEGSTVRICSFIPPINIPHMAQSRSIDNENQHNNMLLGSMTSTIYNNEILILSHIPDCSQSSYIQLCNMSGHIMKKVFIEHGDNTVVIQHSELPPGVYVYSLIVDGQLIDSKRMIIDK